ncbi:unnamed protein product, partial [Owenia fusiformis]
MATPHREYSTTRKLDEATLLNCKKPLKRGRRKTKFCHKKRKHSSSRSQKPVIYENETTPVEETTLDETIVPLNQPKPKKKPLKRGRRKTKFCHKKKKYSSCNNDHHDESISPPRTSTPIRAKTKRPRPSRTITLEQPSDYLQLPAISISQSCSESSDLDSSFLSIEPEGGLCAEWNTSQM